MTFASKCGIRAQMRMILILICTIYEQIPLDEPQHRALPSFITHSRWGSPILPEPTVATQDWVHRGYAMAYTKNDCELWLSCFSPSFFSGMAQEFLLIGGNLISLLVLFFLTFSYSVNQWGLVVGCVNFPQCLQGV